MARTLIALFVVLACAACVDFIEPELPDPDGRFGLDLVLGEDSTRLHAWLSIAPAFLPPDGTFSVRLVDQQMLIDRDDATAFRWSVIASTRIEWTVHIVPASDSTHGVS